ncbi:aminotransferase class I/II-fold pyridoxal phosphate-dependent enzyme [Clostridium amazonitimonense]|uniref:aminotransferase class I/II-fold pyridoxal phosphate-dependent enzyme n=1 Tax=Clostridium amazonitimonense TaxID=1499689 RepID=UPI00050991B2|nr:aminotransferase class V-fold PLP-dependent enzyme [Clostridium amazonitimonense]
MQEIPMLKALSDYVKEDNSLFCMPGHKGGRAFKREIQKIKLEDLILKSDLTEVDGLDNLHDPEGIIKEAEGLLRDLYGSKKSYFLVNGSTSGNMAMIFSAFEEGDKILVERNCHRSIFNGIVMRKLNPIYIKNKLSEEFNTPLGIEMEHLKEIINNHNDIKGIIITYPNYYGVCCDLAHIVELCKDKNIKVLVDAAHGAHFGIHPRLPKNPIKIGADMVVMSAHKTLPSLTQSAYLHVAREELIENTDFYVSAFLSTSPSYMLMLSMDYARWYLEEEGKSSYGKLLENMDNLRVRLRGLEFLKLLDSNVLTGYDNIDIDFSRIVINLRKDLSTRKVEEYLKINKIQVEMIDASNLVLIPSPFNTIEDFERLYKTLINLNIDKVTGNQIKIKDYPIPRQAMLPFEAFKKKKAEVLLEDSRGKVSAVNVCPYPPGTPIIAMGEIIDKESIDMIKYYLSNNINVMGISEGRISVIVDMEEKYYD